VDGVQGERVLNSQEALLTMPTTAPKFRQLPGQAWDLGTNLPDNITAQGDIFNAGPVFAKPVSQSPNSFIWGS